MTTSCGMDTKTLVVGGALNAVGRHVASAVGSTGRALLVTDDRVEALYAARVVESFRLAGRPIAKVVVPHGESSKSLEQASRLYDALASNRIGRDGVIVALGGGVVCDLGGFVAATWMRGLDLVLCPTTLEADIDAAIGGKTAINRPSGKNLVGSFHPARLVVIDPTCLCTLDARDVRAGLAESVKHALIASEEFLAWHEARLSDVLALDDAALRELIERNTSIKLSIVARDPREQASDRMLLNFGHTVGHAIENVCGYALRHGECVGLGMLAACRLSESTASLSPNVTRRVERLLQGIGLPVRLATPIQVERILEAMGQDKKARAGGARFVLLEDVARPVVRGDVPERHVVDACQSLL